MALHHAPGPLTRANAMGTLGLAHLESDDAAGAIPWLEGAVEQCGRFTNRQIEGRFLVFLGEAYQRLGRLDEARRFAARGLEMCRATRFAYGVGGAERALGEVSLAAGRLDEAATHLATARDLFAGMGSRHEVARTTLALAALAHARGDTAQAAALLDEARAAFQALGMPALVARADHLARGRAPPPGGDEGARLSTVA